MRSTTSWYKHEIMKQNFRQAGWISLIYFLILFFAVPLNIFMQLNRLETNAYYHYSSIFEIGIIQVFFLFIMPVLMGMFVLRYLHQKDASDFLHSLPITRTKLFWQQAGFGLVALWVPVIMNGFLLFLINRLLDTSKLYRLMDLAHWLIITLVLLTLIYSVSLILGLLTGITIIQGIFTYIILFLPVGFTFLAAYNLNYAVIGFPISHVISERIFAYSPITDIVNLFYFDEKTMMKAVLYVILTILFLGKAQILYKNRPSEAATQPVAFEWLKPIFIYSFTFCFTLIGGLYFGIFQENYAGIIFGYLIFSVIGYFISQMIVHKTWRVFKEWREYVVFFIGFSLLLVIVSTDVLGIERQIPDLEDVQTAFITDDMYLYSNYSEVFGDVEGFSNPEDIELIQDYHQILIEKASRESMYEYSLQKIAIMYRLNNGKEIVREYSVDWDAHDHRIFEELRNKPTYKKYTQRLFMIEPSQAHSIRFYTFAPYKEVIITDRSEIIELIDLIQRDVLDEPADRSYMGVGIEISFLTQGGSMNYSGSINIELAKEYERVLDWLSDNDLADQALLLADDIESVVLAYSDQMDNYYEQFDYYGHNFYPQSILSGLNQVEITDQDLIEEIIEGLDLYPDDHDYILAIYLKEMPNPYIVLIAESDLPADVNEQIK